MNDSSNNNNNQNNDFVPISEIFTKTNKKQAPQKSFGLLGKKTRKVTVKSEKDSLLTKLLKKKIETEQQLSKGLTEENVKYEKRDIDYFLQIIGMSSKSIPKKNLVPNLVSSPLKIYIYGEQKASFITSDNLYWEYVLNTKNNFSLGSSCLIDNIQVVNKGIIHLKDNHNIFSFYCDDNKKSFYSNITKSIQADSGGNMVLNKNNYFAWGLSGDNMYTFVSDNTNVTINEALDYIQKSIYLNTKSDLETGIKQYNENKNYVYYQQKFKTTVFTPPTLQFPLESDFNYLVTLTLDPDSTFNILKDNAFDFDYYDNLLTIDNVSSFCELIAVFALKENTQQEQKNLFKNCYNFYVNNKKIFSVTKSIYLRFKKIVLGFIDSFQGKISFQKIQKIYEETNLLTQEFNDYILYPDTSNLSREFFSPLSKYCKMATNFFSFSDLSLILNMLSSCCSVLLNPGTNNIEEITRYTALELYDYLFDGKKSTFPDIRSKNAFLANLTGEKNESSLRTALATYRNNLEKIKEKNNMISKNDTKDLLNKTFQLTEAINTATDIIKDLPQELQEEKMKAVKDIQKNLETNPTIENLNNAIIDITALYGEIEEQLEQDMDNAAGEDEIKKKKNAKGKAELFKMKGQKLLEDSTIDESQLTEGRKKKIRYFKKSLGKRK